MTNTNVALEGDLFRERLVRINAAEKVMLRLLYLTSSMIAMLLTPVGDIRAGGRVPASAIAW
jgi:hypothetical protein